MTTSKSERQSSSSSKINNDNVNSKTEIKLLKKLESLDKEILGNQKTKISKNELKEDDRIQLLNCLKVLNNNNDHMKIRSDSTTDDVSVTLNDSHNNNTKNEGYYSHVIIDELKKENKDLKLTIKDRDRKLKEAAEKIQETVQDNSHLALRLKEALFLQNNDDGDDDDGGVQFLHKKLAESEATNRNLQTYIGFLKKSYTSVFGSLST